MAYLTVMCFVAWYHAHELLAAVRGCDQASELRGADAVAPAVEKVLPEVTSGACNAAALAGCATAKAFCSKYNPGKAGLCTCFHAYDECVGHLGCSASFISSIEKACRSAGCTAAQCTV